jgi:hypothetical protein
VGGVGYGTAPIDSVTNCDGQWLAPTVVSTYTVGNDPTQWSDPYEDYLPPGMESCSGEYSNGASWLQTTISAPVVQACPAGMRGTQSCSTSYMTSDTCNDGLVAVGKRGPSTISCDTTNCAR